MEATGVFIIDRGGYSHSGCKGKHLYKKKTKKLQKHYETDKVIDGWTIKRQMSDTSDILRVGDITPPTKQYMRLKLYGGCEKLFAAPAMGNAQSRRLKKFYTRNLVTKAMSDDIPSNENEGDQNEEDNDKYLIEPFTEPVSDNKITPIPVGKPADHSNMKVEQDEEKCKDEGMIIISPVVDSDNEVDSAASQNYLRQGESELRGIINIIPDFTDAHTDTVRYPHQQETQNDPGQGQGQGQGNKDKGGDSEAQPFACIICGLGFNFLEQLNRHKLLHPGCEFCNKIFATADKCGRHFWKSHPCEDCDRRFENFKVLQKHRLSHFRDKCDDVWRCNVCDCVFCDQELYKIHSKKHPKCHRCRQTFKEKRFLDYHLSTCTNNTQESRIYPNKHKEVNHTSQEVTAKVPEGTPRPPLMGSQPSQMMYKIVNGTLQVMDQNVSNTPQVMGKNIFDTPQVIGKNVSKTPQVMGRNVANTPRVICKKVPDTPPVIDLTTSDPIQIKKEPVTSEVTQKAVYMPSQVISRKINDISQVNKVPDTSQVSEKRMYSASQRTDNKESNTLRVNDKTVSQISQVKGKTSSATQLSSNLHYLGTLTKGIRINGEIYKIGDVCETSDKRTGGQVKYTLIKCGTDSNVTFDNIGKCVSKTSNTVSEVMDIGIQKNIGTLKNIGIQKNIEIQKKRKPRIAPAFVALTAEEATEKSQKNVFPKYPYLLTDPTTKGPENNKEIVKHTFRNCQKSRELTGEEAVRTWVGTVGSVGDTEHSSGGKDLSAKQSTVLGTARSSFIKGKAVGTEIKLSASGIGLEGYKVGGKVGCSCLSTDEIIKKKFAQPGKRKNLSDMKSVYVKCKRLKSLTCPQCCEVFYWDAAYEKHMKQHLEIDRKNTDKTSLKDRVRSNSPAYSKIKTLDNIHVKLNKIALHECDICQRIFVDRNALTKHMREHFENIQFEYLKKNGTVVLNFL